MTDTLTLQLPVTKFDAFHKNQIMAYNGLAPLHQAVVHILAIIYHETARTHILNSLKKLLWDDADVRAYKAKDLDPILESLVGSRLVLNDGIYFRCFPFFTEPICQRLVDHGRFVETAEAVQDAMPIKGRDFDGLPYYNEEMVRELRIGLYRGDAEFVIEMLAKYDKRPSFSRNGDHPLLAFFRNSFDAKWISGNLPQSLQALIAQALVEDFLLNPGPVDPEKLAFMTVHTQSSSAGPARERALTLLGEQAILAGRLDRAEEIRARETGLAATLIAGDLAFLKNRNSDAIVQYEEALRLLKKTTGKRKVFFNTVSGFFYILALVKSGDRQHLQSGKTYAAIAVRDPDNRLQKAFRTLIRLIDARDGDPGALEDIKEVAAQYYESDTFCSFLQVLAFYWLEKKRAQRFVKLLHQLHDKAIQSEQLWLSAEISALLSRMSAKEETFGQKAAEFFERTGIHSIVDLIEPESRWQQALNALIGLKKQDNAIVENNKPSRLVWLLRFNEKYGHWDLSPREQIKTANGAWSKGRKIALKRLYYERETFDFLTPQDELICAGIEENRQIYHGYPDISYHFNPGALKALTSHPLVFSEDSPDMRLEIVQGRPEMLVNRRKDGKFEIAVAHGFNAQSEVQLVRETPSRFKVIETGDEVRRIAQIVGDRLTVPASGKDKLLEAVECISAMVTVHSQIAGIGGDAEQMPADHTPNFYLRPWGAGLKFDVMVHPFGMDGPGFRPGAGGETVISEIKGKLRQTQRDLVQEKQLADQAVFACPTLQAAGEPSAATWQWELDDPETCLEVLMELNALEPTVILKWPEGERFKIRQQAPMNRFYINVKKRQDWFSVSGELKLDDGEVLSMERLLALLQDAPGRFVRMQDGQFLALTREFRKRLDEWAAFSNKSGNDRLFHPLAALSLETAMEDLGGFRSDNHWKAHLQRFDNARSLKPEIPSTFTAELRDYQAQGFGWLARLSHWGVGALLADDMGLGKTIQALAVMMTTAAEGPSLVIAPTSVCMNWEAEALRFAPSLNIVTLGNGDRDAIVENLKPLDLLVVSYGLLQQEKVAQMLAGVHFKTIVLDEAQAIKNLTTKRSRAAMNLHGDFKLITTGTPIENHLGELWNLFRFINPDFLGSLTDFNEKFAVPIEKYQDRDARRRLKKLVQPYILRRTKSQVLEELPPRTDILLQVELSPEELAFYEALRRKALEMLAAEDGAGKNINLRILAEIMKLRRACCNPKLVVPDLNLPSAKLTVFGEIVDELLAGGHKALVFSQFTGHLDLIRKYVESKAISYQYLDGSTPQKDRKARVTAFQGGDGDLFLISLKAGGLGLNLTAADYVIHMDPWWNPAIEDQAADRAHRIGQMRPVTVYSLIARHTIEEKIVALHKSKRDLADSLLDGADMSGKMTAEELLRLIRS